MSSASPAPKLSSSPDDHLATDRDTLSRRGREEPDRDTLSRRGREEPDRGTPPRRGREEPLRDTPPRPGREEPDRGTPPRPGREEFGQGERASEPDARPHWRDTFASLRVRNYRIYVSSQVLTNTCGWMQRVAQDWLVLSLTGNVAMVGLTVTLQLGPMLLFGLWGGVIADRFDKRRLLMLTQSLFGLSALTLGILALTGAVQPWHVLTSATFLGLATVVDNPARQAFVPEVAGRRHLRNAISINSTVFQMGALVGPALAGAGIALVGEGWAFVVNSGACTAAVLLLVAMKPAELAVAPRVARARGQLREGLSYVGGKPDILWAVVLIGFVAITGINMATVLAAYADGVFDIGSGGYGLLNSCVAAGAVIGALASTRRRTLRLRHLVYGAAVLGLLQVLAGTLRSPVMFSVTLVAVGTASLLYLTAGNTMVQTAVATTMRGRVMALYILVFFGAQAASGTIIGWVAHNHGAQTAMMVCGAGPLLGALVVGGILALRTGLAPRVILRDRPGRGVVYVLPHRPNAPHPAVAEAVGHTSLSSRRVSARSIRGGLQRLRSRTELIARSRANESLGAKSPAPDSLMAGSCTESRTRDAARDRRSGHQDRDARTPRWRQNSHDAGRRHPRMDRR